MSLSSLSKCRRSDAALSASHSQQMKITQAVLDNENTVRRNQTPRNKITTVRSNAYTIIIVQRVFQLIYIIR